MGSILGLVLALPLVLREEFSLVWVMVAAFFVIFSIPSLMYMPKDGKGLMTVRRAAVWGLTSFKQLWGEVMRKRELRRFLLAYFLYIDGVLTRLTMFGAAYITLVCLLPQALVVMWNVPFYLGGTSLLIVVVVVMDFMSQVQSHLMSHQYDSLMKKANLNKHGRR